MKSIRMLPALLLAALFVGRTVRAEGWSLLHPFSSGTTQSQPQKPLAPARKTTSQQPSTPQKLGTGTKSFFGKIGDKLSLKKSTTTTTTPRPSTSLATTKKSSSWNPFHSEEKKPQTVSDFIASPRPGTGGSQ
jgi:hypothetical protein